jgi:ethanolamine utilization protein EutN
MYLGKVIGAVWSTVKTQGLTGRPLYVVQPVTPELEPVGRTLVCADTVGAGPGCLVYYCRGREASLPFLPDDVPSDSTIIAIIDELRVDRDKVAADDSSC